METNLNTIHIFKTDIGEITPNCAIRQILDNHSEIQEWSIDCEDIDCVLRVVSETLTPEEIITLINKIGHECQELS
ncbi:hypothetical protein IRZ83_14425 [Flavobacterium sp. JLP]|uniref:hypothetical protein n=1 Tax=unclassified Flavobacterium TaxID=196869 RepID=UPI00049379B3|nr:MULTISPECIES: hypothetical protein [unclassified Flavobacterium]MBF4493356.1 hypothetical protein [Flavobacterium sp. MR2016-29]MBF4507869.1 hypothetical protein [Flavobacterium sp. JLP]